MFFWKLFRHNFAENGPQDLKMVKEDASGNSTQSIIKKNQLLKKNMGKVMASLVTRAQHAPQRSQVVSRAVSGHPRQIGT